MEKFIQGVNRFIRDEEGVTAIEYGLIAALIAGVIFGSVQIVGTQRDLTFSTIGDCLGDANTGAAF